MVKKKDKFRSIHISDLHWDRSNYENLDKELRSEFLPYVEKNGEVLDCIFINGDYWHQKLNLNENVTKVAIKFMYDLVTLAYQYDIKIRIIRGTRSHDFDQLENFRGYERDYDFKIFNTFDVEEIVPNFFVLYLPEEYMDNQDEYYKEIFELEEGTGYDMIVFHGTFDFTAFDSQKQESERQISNAAVFNSDEILSICHGPIINSVIHIGNSMSKSL